MIHFETQIPSVDSQLKCNDESGLYVFTKKEKHTFKVNSSFSHLNCLESTNFKEFFKTCRSIFPLPVAELRSHLHSMWTFHPTPLMSLCRSRTVPPLNLDLRVTYCRGGDGESLGGTISSRQALISSVILCRGATTGLTCCSIHSWTVASG